MGLFFRFSVKWNKSYYWSHFNFFLEIFVITKEILKVLRWINFDSRIMSFISSTSLNLSHQNKLNSKFREVILELHNHFSNFPGHFSKLFPKSFVNPRIKVNPTWYMQLWEFISNLSLYSLNYAEDATSLRCLSLRHCARATRLPSKECRNGGEQLATLRSIWPARDLNLRLPATETNCATARHSGRLTVSCKQKLSLPFKLLGVYELWSKRQSFFCHTDFCRSALIDKKTDFYILYR